jgi:hypothetical protein
MWLWFYLAFKNETFLEKKFIEILLNPIFGWLQKRYLKSIYMWRNHLQKIEHGLGNKRNAKWN